MRSCSTLAVIWLGCAGMANAQGRPIDWPNYGSDAQRSGWQKSDSRITKENVKDFQLVLKRKLANGQPGPRSLTPPVVIGNLISYRGFKELAFVVGSSGHVWSIDADIDRMFWDRQLSAAPTADASCGAGVTAIPALTPPMNFAAGRPRPAAGARPPAATPPATAPAAPVGRISATGFGASRPVFVLAADGKLHQLNSATGEDQFPPLQFLPPNGRASSLTLHNGVLYTAGKAGCTGAQNGVWAVNLTEADPKPVSFTYTGGSAGGIGGFALGNDGTVYLQTGAGQADPAAGKWAETLLALTPKDLKVKQYFRAPGSGAVTPVVFTWKEKELVVSAGKNGSLFVHDAQALGGSDHKAPLYETAALSSAGVWGGLSTWEDSEGIRWVLAPVWGALAPNLKSLATTGDATHGAIVAFKLEEQQGKAILTPTWVSRDMRSPLPPVITSGVVFAVSAGEYTRDERPAGSTNAVLYALDGTTGKEMYSTGNQVGAAANLTGVTVANGRVYFTTTDSTLYAFGVFLER